MKILIADDEEIERTALKDILCADPSIEIFETIDGQETLDLLCDGFKPDLCLVDIRMPRVDGLELIQRIRREPLMRNLRVVVTSGNRNRNVIIALSQLNLSGYLLKPYEKAKVHAVIDPILNEIKAQIAATRTVATMNLLEKTLLVVDDESETRAILKAAAKQEPGWEVVEAQNGEDALLKLRQGLKPSLCFCDLMMPKMDGFTFVRRVREDSLLRSLPIAIISSEHKIEVVRQLAELKISGYMLKPVDPVKIRALMRQIVNAPPLDEKATPLAEAKKALGVPMKPNALDGSAPLPTT
jgi:CheY-like chemotaxis protein